MIGKVWYTSKEASFNKLNNSVDEPFTNKINNMHLEYRQSKGKYMLTLSDKYQSEAVLGRF